MKFIYNNEEYNIIIVKKKSNKNTYIRVKDDLNIYITTNYFATGKYIEKLVKDNEKSIIRMIEHIKIKKANNSDFRFLGNRYEVVYMDIDKLSIGNNKVFMKKETDIDKWYKKVAKKIFKERLDIIYENFSENIPYPNLRIRKMTTRWGVCNTKSKTITLNLELIKRNIKYLDYVIVHELSHLIHANHSKSFWSLVEKNCADYKKIKNDMKKF